MNRNFGRSNMMFLVILICASVFLVIAGQIAWAQESSSITLNDAIEIALENNIVLRRSANQVSSSEVSVGQSKAVFFPDLSASASASQRYARNYDPMTDRTESQETQSVSLGLSSRLTLFDGFSRIAALKSAKAQLLSAEASLQQAGQSVVFETISRYLQVLMDEELLVSERENLIAQRQQLERIEIFYGAGNRSRADVLQQRAEISQAELRVLRAEEYLNISKLQLFKTIGLLPSTEYAVETVPVENLVDELTTDDVDRQWSSALDDRADVAAQSFFIDAAEQDLQTARSGYWPSLSLSADVGSGYNRPSEYGSFSDQMLDINPNARIGLTLSLPIFDRSVTKSSVQRAQIQLANVQLSLEDLRQTVVFEVQQAQFDYSTAQKELESARAQREYARQALEVTEERYDVGSAILAELSLARAQYMAASNDWIQANYNLLLSRVALDYVSGRLEDCPVFPL